MLFRMLKVLALIIIGNVYGNEFNLLDPQDFDLLKVELTMKAESSGQVLQQTYDWDYFRQETQLHYQHFANYSVEVNKDSTNGWRNWVTKKLLSNEGDLTINEILLFLLKRDPDALITVLKNNFDSKIKDNWSDYYTTENPNKENLSWRAQLEIADWHSVSKDLRVWRLSILTLLNSASKSFSDENAKLVTAPDSSGSFGTLISYLDSPYPYFERFKAIELRCRSVESS